MRIGYIIDTFTSVDIQEIVKTGGKVIQISESVNYREKFKVSPFRKVKDKIFALRQKYKKGKNDAMQLLLKLLMNSLYGESIVNTTYNSTEGMIIKLQQLKGQTKLKFYKNLSNYYDEMNIRKFKFEQDLFSKNAQRISKIYQEALLLMKFLQTKPQVKDMNIIYYDLYYTVIKNKDEKEMVNKK